MSKKKKKKKSKDKDEKVSFGLKKFNKKSFKSSTGGDPRGLAGSFGF